jgi:hypothetical protein
LKEGERVCGGRGQFGNKPLWDLNTILTLWRRQGNIESRKSDPLGKCFENGMQREAANA